LVLVLIAGGAGSGLYFTGRLPFLAKKPAPKKTEAKAEEKAKPKAAATAQAPATPPRAPITQASASTTDPDRGRKRLAKLWNQVDTARLVVITESWRDPELAQILARMEPDKVAEFLGTVEPQRASNLSRAIQREAARVTTPANE
jgi:hypothetical protein